MACSSMRPISWPIKNDSLQIVENFKKMSNCSQVCGCGGKSEKFKKKTVRLEIIFENISVNSKHSSQIISNLTPIKQQFQMSVLNGFHTYTLFVSTNRKDMYIENFGQGYCGPCSVIQAITLSQNLYAGSDKQMMMSAADYSKRISRPGNTKSVLLKKIADAMRFLREGDQTTLSRRSQAVVEHWTDEVTIASY